MRLMRVTVVSLSQKFRTSQGRSLVLSPLLTSGNRIFPGTFDAVVALGVGVL